MLDNCYYTNKLLKKISLFNTHNKNFTNKVDIIEIKKAIFYAKKYHNDQRRQSGEPYYSHPLEVAYMVIDYLFRTDIIIASILHDTIEDTILTKEMISLTFGSVVANQVEDLTRIKKDRKISFMEMVELLIQQKKYETLIIKCIDRLHNLQTLTVKSLEKQKQTIKETFQTLLMLVNNLNLDIEQEIAISQRSISIIIYEIHKLIKKETIQSMLTNAS